MSAWENYPPRLSTESDDLKSEEGRSFDDYSHPEEELDIWKGVFLDYGGDAQMECEPPSSQSTPTHHKTQVLPVPNQQYAPHPPHSLNGYDQNFLDFDMIGDSKYGHSFPPEQDQFHLHSHVKKHMHQIPPQAQPIGGEQFHCDFTKKAEIASKLEKKSTEKQRREKLSEQFQELAKTLGLGENHKNNRIEILQATIKTLNRINAEKKEIAAERDQLRLQLSYCHGLQMASTPSQMAGRFHPGMVGPGVFVKPPLGAGPIAASSTTASANCKITPSPKQAI